MGFVPASELVSRAAREGYAVPSFCVWDAETMETVLRVASDCRAPVILMNGPVEQCLLAPALGAEIARAVAARYDVPAALLLDHGDSLACVDACLAGGYTSVMLDYSARPFDFRLLPVRNVQHHPLERQRRVLGRDHHRVIMEPYRPPVARDHAIRADEVLVWPVGALNAHEHPLPVLRVERVLPDVRVRGVLRRRMPEKRLDLRAHIYPRALLLD